MLRGLIIWTSACVIVGGAIAGSGVIGQGWPSPAAVERHLARDYAARADDPLASREGAAEARAFAGAECRRADRSRYPVWVLYLCDVRFRWPDGTAITRAEAVGWDSDRLGGGLPPPRPGPSLRTRLGEVAGS